MENLAPTNTDDAWFKSTLALLEKEDGSLLEPELIQTIFHSAAFATSKEEAQKIYILFKKLCVVAPFASVLYYDEAAMAGVSAYSLSLFDIAEAYFEYAVDGDSISGGNNLAYMIRRGETANKDIADIDIALELLKPGIKARDAYALVNTALIYAINLGSESDWQFADSAISLISANDTPGIVSWWNSGIGEESKLVHLFLLRHQLINNSEFGNIEELFSSVSKAYKNVPLWMKTFS